MVATTQKCQRTIVTMSSKRTRKRESVYPYIAEYDVCIVQRVHFNSIKLCMCMYLCVWVWVWVFVCVKCPIKPLCEGMWVFEQRREVFELCEECVALILQWVFGLFFIPF